MTLKNLSQSIQDRSAKIGIIGLGYVGLPLIKTFVDEGFSTTGFDTDPIKIEALNLGQSYIKHIPADTIRSMLDLGLFKAVSEMSGLADMDVIIICVPTPLDEKREPDLHYVVSTAEAIAGHLRPGQLISLESTTYPGTCTDVVKPILEKGGLKSGSDFYLAYSPEREDPGNETHSTSGIPKVVGGDGEGALSLACLLYDQIVVSTVPVTSLDTAEAVKLTENIFRSVNIALVNELKVIYEKMGIDVWEVIDAAKTKPFGYMPFYPGPGLGGHCIPIDPFYLSWKAKQHGVETRFIELAGEINTAMPGRVISVLEEALRERQAKPISDCKILIIGLAYKKNVDDIRESPAFVLIEGLEAKGGSVDYYDPYVPEIPMTREHANLSGRFSITLSPETLAGYDAALICTDHDNIDYGAIVANSTLVIDTRNATKSITGVREKILKA